jgi:hypothetical protein
MVLLTIGSDVVLNGCWAAGIWAAGLGIGHWAAGMTKRDRRDWAARDST